MSCSLHGRRTRGVLQHQVSARLRELPAPGQHVHTRAQQGGARPVKRSGVIFVKWRIFTNICLFFIYFSLGFYVVSDSINNNFILHLQKLPLTTRSGKFDLIAINVYVWFTNTNVQNRSFEKPKQLKKNLLVTELPLPTRWVSELVLVMQWCSDVVTVVSLSISINVWNWERAWECMDLWDQGINLMAAE